MIRIETSEKQGHGLGECRHKRGSMPLGPNV